MRDLQQVQRQCDEQLNQAGLITYILETRGESVAVLHYSTTIR